MLANNSFPMFLRRVIPAIILANLLLILLGLALYPTVIQQNGLLGVIADTAILLIYGFLALFSPLSVGKARPELLKTSLLLGLISGLCLSTDLVAGYLITHDAQTNANTSLIAYGIFLGLVALSAFLVARRTGRVRSGLVAALWSVIVALLIWFAFEFAAFYLFSSTPSGREFIRLEMEADFARSKATDYPGFVMSDFYGAGFYHLLLGLILAMLLGSLGGLVGKLFKASTRI